MLKCLIEAYFTVNIYAFILLNISFLLIADKTRIFIGYWYYKIVEESDCAWAWVLLELLPMCIALSIENNLFFHYSIEIEERQEKDDKVKVVSLVKNIEDDQNDNNDSEE